MSLLTVGTKAPAFTLSDQNGTSHSLSEYEGSWVVLYFYPKDDTPGCTIEACNFRDHFENLKQEGVMVFGVSKDSPQSHTKFIHKFNLPFTLLSDESIEMIQAYGAWGEKKFMGKTFKGISRVTYIIDPEGMIRKVYPAVKPQAHAEEILEEVRRLRG